MNEAYVANDIRKRLDIRGFKVMKLADRSTVGYPDTLALRGGRGVFFEFKFMEVAKTPKEFKAWSKLGKEIQLLTAVEIERTGFPIHYVIVYYINGMKYVAMILPSMMKLYKENKRGIPISLWKFNDWLNYIDQTYPYRNC